MGVFPSNFVVMLDAQPAAFEPPPYEPVPALPPKPGMWPYGPGKVSYVNHCRFPFVCGRLLYLVRISFYLFIFLREFTANRLVFKLLFNSLCK